MGIGVHELQILRLTNLIKDGLGEVVTFGRQGIGVPSRIIERELGVPVSISNHAYCESMLSDHFGAEGVSSIDNSDYEGATVIADLNADFDLKRTFDTVIDFGTTEHVFDVAAVFRNAVRLCKVGGSIVHSLPANSECGHGFYQFSPDLFLSLYSSRNGFAPPLVYVASLMDERNWWRVEKQKPTARVMANSATATYVMCIATKIRDVAGPLLLQQADYQAAWADGEPSHRIDRPRIERLREHFKSSAFATPANILYRTLLAKTGLTRFNEDLTKVSIASELDRARLTADMRPRHS